MDTKLPLLLLDKFLKVRTELLNYTIIPQTIGIIIYHTHTFEISSLSVMGNVEHEKNIVEIVTDATAIKEFESTLSVETLVREDASVPIAYVNAAIKGQRVSRYPDILFVLLNI